MIDRTTICALSTPSGNGAIAVIRMSGNDAIAITDKFFSMKKGKLTSQKPNSLHYGSVMDGKKNIDDVVVGIFHGPKSYTGEDIVEISCHGSQYIQQKILQLIINNGARLAEPGEFTMRAFMNGKMDLTQAEAVADLIASSSAASHDIAMKQMRGGFSSKIKELRTKLLSLISLLELELDFSDEDVEFADRTEITKLLEEIDLHCKKLTKSFELGNAIKNGVPVAIIGKTNVGKSTLLNVLLNEERAIVSEIEGTTRDTIEDVINIDGVNYRFIDTAGLRSTDDTIEKIGIERTREKITKARIVLHLVDATAGKETITGQLNDVQISDNQKRIVIINKSDLLANTDESNLKQVISQTGIKTIITISAKNNTGIDELITALKSSVHVSEISEDDVIISNSRHYEALINAVRAIERAKKAIHDNLPNDLVAVEFRDVLNYLGSITGEITEDEILGNIFMNFCIGK